MAGKPTAAQAKAARQKKLVIGGAVLLAIIMVIQGPKLLKMLKGDAPATAAPAAITPLPVAPGPGIVPAAPDGVQGKLVSFESFGSKDPFIQQVRDGAASADAPEEASSTGEAAGTGSGAEATSSDGGAAEPTAFKTDPSGKSSPSSTGAKTATIEVNGIEHTVAAEKTFPKSDPVFKLLSVGEDSVQIAIADGSFKDGGKAISLTVDKAVTLMNTADGKRYKLLLVTTTE